MNKKDEKQNIKEVVLSMPFFTVLFFLTLVGLIVPLRPTKSVMEKRDLSSFPDFTFETLANGEYFEEIGNWFADTFPGRESWINISRQIESLHGINDTSIDLSKFKSAGAVPENIRNTEAPDSGEKQVIEEIRNTEAPANTASGPLVDDSVSGRTEFGELSPEEIDIEIYSATIQIGDTAYAAQGFSRTVSNEHAAEVSAAADRLKEDGITLYDLPVPTSIGILVPDKIRDSLNSADQEEILEYLQSGEEGHAEFVNTFDLLSEHRNEYVYYHTDHHWSALGAYYGYVAFCEKAGIAPVPLGNYTEKSMGDFKGSFYYSISNSKKIKIDELFAYSPPGNCRLFVMDSDGEYREYDVVTDKSGDVPENKYISFINGDNAVSVIKNEDIPEAPKCVVLKDSFGNPFSVYLSQHYSEVYILDYRMFEGNLRSFAREVGAEDVIIVQSIGVSQSSRATGLLSQVLK